MVYTVPLIIFMDDISGNISKQWNKHHAIYMSNANVPHEMLEKEFFVCFVMSSLHAAPMELMQAMKQSICDAATSGVTAWDCKDNQEVLLIPHGLFIAGDNPMQAEECSHTGLNCNYLCRMCDAGGTKEYKASLDGYNSLFASGNLRTPEGTAANIQQQFETALKPGATEKIKNVVLTTGIRDMASISIINALLELGKKLQKCVAGTQAMLEAEYFWGQTVFLLDKAKLMDIFQTRLQSVDTDRLNTPCLNAEYICHYKGGLIRKHFKSLSQVMPFVIYDLVPSTVLNA
ncbi:uncharacterized protein EDB91DRAFT_1236406 [Suillus paluster]|uniref:uncharacterized protein n=1 Tax=Suillus paluster TaxID=48578 RepID=UPI001B876FAF|nr:uncharacterized protein EDB91DRAFT_1236406 [Suillus paluster]KAG1744931.1 hypothetical protein EDB91DRAFT_1236406 [Suillus paluster]